MGVEKFEEFLREFYEKDLMRVASKGGKSLKIDFALLDKFDPILADKLLNEPEKTLNQFREAIQNIDLPEGKVEIEPRIRNLPDQCSVRIRNLRSKHIGKFLCLDGVVRRASEVKPEIAIAIFECPDCGSKLKVRQTDRTLKPPTLCDCGRRGHFNFSDRILFDTRWVFIEEPFEIVSGEKPGEVSVYLRNDLTTPEMQSKTDPGNRIKVNGIVKEVPKTYRGKVKTQMDILVDANYVEPAEIEWEEVKIDSEDEQKIKELARDPEIYNKIVSSIAPSIYGMDAVKEAIMLQMFGGVPHRLPDGTRIRGDIHTLLLGDPSTAKSQLLKLVASVIPRGKYVAGRGTTAAGLTATVVKDEIFLGGWALEAGAIVLANKGILCIDEFDKMSKEDQIAMHEALEQQTVSIAKASIIATLPAQTSVLAGANPKLSRFDRYRPIAEQIDIPDTLLSRFDLKFALQDVPEKVKDEKLATHILETRLEPERAEPLISPEFLRKYIAYAKKRCIPIMTREAAEKLKEFYLKMRGLYIGEETVAITLRQNEALMRLAEAAAKIRLSDKVGVQDAERAIRIMEFSIKKLGYDIETKKYDIDRTEGVPASKRSKIVKLLDIIDRLEKELGKQISLEELRATAQDEGIRERDVDDLVERLIRDGTLHYPKIGFIQKTR